MTLIACCSLKGSPGVTTAIQAFAEVWPAGRGLLIAELDPAGGDLAARLDLAPEPGLMTLAAAGRRDLNAALVMEHTTDVAPEVAVLLAPPTAGHVRRALDLLGDRLAEALADIDGAEVVVDCGRLDPSGEVPSWATAAERLLVFIEPTAAGVAHAVNGLPELARAGCEVSVVLVGEASPASPHLYPTVEVAAALDAPVAGIVASDDRAAAVFDGRRRGQRVLRRSELLRSARDLTAILLGVEALAPQDATTTTTSAAASPAAVAMEAAR